MLPPDKVNPGTDPLIEHGSLNLPTPQTTSPLRLRARSGCYMALFLLLLMIVASGCWALTRGTYQLAKIAASQITPMTTIGENYITAALIVGLLLFLAFVVGFFIAPGRRAN